MSAINSQLLAAGLSLSMMFPARAMQPEVASSSSAPADDSLARAKQLFAEGQARFDAADYNLAIELWTQAYTEVPQQEFYTRSLLLRNMASAHERAFEVDRKVRHLRQAKILLDQFEQIVPDLYEDQAERAREAKWLDDKQASIDAKLRQWEASQQRKPDRAAQPGPAKPSGKALLITGGTLLGVAAVMGGLSGWAAVEREGAIADFDDGSRPRLDAQTDAQNWHASMIGLAVSAAALLCTGAILLGIGAARRKATTRQRAGRNAFQLRPHYGQGTLTF